MVLVAKNFPEFDDAYLMMHNSWEKWSESVYGDQGEHGL
jgi:hypothetical protein